MRTFVIADSSKRKAKPIGVLTWRSDSEAFDSEAFESENCQGVFSLQLCSDCGEGQLPLSLSFCARREGRRATPEESRDWVRSRIVPETRHNIAAVLRANGLVEYDEVELLSSCKGRSSDDDLLVYEVDIPQELASERIGAEARAAQENDEHGAGAQSMADLITASVRRQRTGPEVSYAFVGLDGAAGTCNGAAVEAGEAPDLANGYSAAQRIGSLIRTERRKRGLTQKQLAAHAGITQTVLSRVESGAGNPTLALLEEIAAALDLHLEIDLE